MNDTTTATGRERLARRINAAERRLIEEREAGREPAPELWAAISARRAWLNGEISGFDLRVAQAGAGRVHADADRAKRNWAAAGTDYQAYFTAAANVAQAAALVVSVTE